MFELYSCIIHDEWQLYSEYKRLSNMLNLPPCSNNQWNRIIQWLEHYVTELTEVSCQQVRNDVKKRGDHLQWTVSFDGFYQTRGHFSNNSSATLHDYHSGRIAWFKHRTKRGPGHNWEGTLVVQKATSSMRSWERFATVGSTSQRWSLTKILLSTVATSRTVPSRTVPTILQRLCTSICRE